MGEDLYIPFRVVKDRIPRLHNEPPMGSWVGYGAQPLPGVVTAEHAGPVVGCDNALGSDRQKGVGRRLYGSFLLRVCEVRRELCAESSQMLSVKVSNNQIANGQYALQEPRTAPMLTER